jgi:hypothetical protein
VLRVGPFDTPCETQAPSACRYGLPPIAVGSAATVAFDSPALPQAKVVPVSEAILARPLQSAFVALVQDRVVDFVNLDSRETARVELEGYPARSANEFREDHDTVDTPVEVGCPAPAWDPDRLFLLPRAASGHALMGVLPWVLTVSPPVATATSDGNRVRLEPGAGNSMPVDAVLTARLPGWVDGWTFPLSVCRKVATPPDEGPDDAADAWEDVPEEVVDAPGDAPEDAPEDLPPSGDPGEVPDGNGTDADAADADAPDAGDLPDAVDAPDAGPADEGAGDAGEVAP